MSTTYFAPDPGIPEWVRVPKPPISLAIPGTSGRSLRRRWWMVYLYPDRRCSYCAAPLIQPTLAHVVPVCDSGMTPIDNLVPACSPCNHRKDKQSLLTYLRGRC